MMGPIDMTMPTSTSLSPSERARQVERPDHQRRHHHRRDQRVQGQAGAQHSIAQYRHRNQGGCRPRLRQHEEAGAQACGQQQGQIEPIEMTAPNRHGQRIGRKREAKQQRTQRVEACALSVALAAGHRQVAIRQQDIQHAQRHHDQKDRPPAGPGEQEPAQRRPKRGADGRHGAEQPHGAAGPVPGRGVAHQRHGQRHQDGRTEALQRAGNNQQPERRGNTAQDRGQREQQDAG
jgi:hypothetical protein